MWVKPAFPLATALLATLNIVAWFLVVIANAVSHGSHGVAGIPKALIHHVDSTALLNAGAIDGATLGSGGWWRLVTSQFLHVEPAHMLFNMVGLVLLGTVLERLFGHWRFAMIYLAAGTAGQLASVLFAPTLVSSGASQAVIGLASAYGTTLLLRPHLQGGRRIVPMVSVLAWTLVQVGLDLASAGAIKPGHLVGFLAGFVLALVVRPPIDSHRESLVADSYAAASNR